MATAVTNPAAATTGAASMSDLYLSLNRPAVSTEADASTASADRFLTMLVTQLQNQDPLNPMDNAQITSQMAQINAVTGLDKVNQSVQSLNGQLLQMQALQGAALVGHDVALEGNVVALSNGVGRGAVELAGTASAVKVEVLNANQQVVATLQLGPLEAGRHNFEWNAGNAAGNASYTFRAAATQGGQPVAGRTLMIDRVQSVSTSGNALMLTLARNGDVPLADIAGFN